ncbi:hypothetical protein LOD99_633 [Oopsacas minuta]|uniref:Myotubularin phosphatase domain-containing protein n=1 Tax=Oopsacas minuta TaxID=111878 RepID=A0AAV7K0G7_9METZ|nr:hypothetical protein LOD99_633 [Oopsacas minuta]
MACLKEPVTSPRLRFSHIEDRISFSLFERLSSTNESCLGLSFSLTPGEDPLKEHEHVLTLWAGSPVQLANLCITSSRLLLLIKSASPTKLRQWFDESSAKPKTHPQLHGASSLTTPRNSSTRRSSKIKKIDDFVTWRSEENISRMEVGQCTSPENGIANSRGQLSDSESAKHRDLSQSVTSEENPSPLRQPNKSKKVLTLLRKTKANSMSLENKSTFYCPIDVNDVHLHELPITKPNSLKPSTTRSKKRASKSFTTHDKTFCPVKTVDSLVAINDHPLSNKPMIPNYKQNSSSPFNPLLPPMRSGSFTSSSIKNEVHSLPEFYPTPPSLIPEVPDTKKKSFIDFSNAQQVNIPYGLISRIEKVNRFVKLPFASYLDGFRIICKNCHTLTILFHPAFTHDLDAIVTSIEFFLNFQSHRSVYEVALSYRNALRIPDTFSAGDHAGLYDLDKELVRLGLKKTQDWRLFELESQNHSLPYSYPPRLVVPLSYSNTDICKLAPLFRDNRFPVLCWRHPGNGAALLRSGSIPRKKFEKSQLDGDYLAAVCHNNSRQGDKLVILCERDSSELIDGSQPSSISKEKMQTFLYPGCVLEHSFSHTPLPKLKVLLSRLQALLNSEATGDYLTMLQSTRWMREINKLLQTAKYVAEKLEDEQMSVLVSFESGYDFTTQVVSLAQLMLDPYYRTMDGFQVLIQKEWIWFGHKFQQRNLPLSEHHKEESPVFLQFIECVWQIMQQFPSVFEFNEEFLHFLILHSYSARFGDFLANSIEEYFALELDKKTLSLWTWLHFHNLEYNNFYNSTYHLLRSNSTPFHTFVCLTPVCALPALKPWTSYYAKYNTNTQIPYGSGVNLLNTLSLLNSTLQDLKQKEHDLKQKLLYPYSDSSSESEEDTGVWLSKERQARALSFGLKQRGSLKRNCVLSTQSNDENFYSHLPKELKSEAQATKEVTISMYVCSGYLYRQNKPVIGTSKRFWAVCDLNKNYFALFHAPEAHIKQEVPKYIFKLSEIDKVHLTTGSNPSSLTISFSSKGKSEKFHASTKYCSEIWFNCLSIRST